MKSSLHRVVNIYSKHENGSQLTLYRGKLTSTVQGNDIHYVR